MLDVHPPHHAANTWRDFFIHIATITVGLLIAIGLEQSIEALHRRHQRHQLQEDLHREALRNRDISALNFAFLDRDMLWLLQLRGRVDALRNGGEKKSFVYPAPPSGYPGDPNHSDRRLPADAVWNTARQNGLVDLLPREEGQFDTTFYRLAGFSSDAFEDLRKSWTRLTAFEFQFDGGSTPTQPAVARMTALQLDQYAALIDAAFMDARNVKRHLKVQLIFTQSAIEQHAVPSTEEYLSTHPDDFPELRQPQATPPHESISPMGVRRPHTIDPGVR